MLAKKAKRIVFVVCSSSYALACVTVKQIFFTFYWDYNLLQSTALFVLINSLDLLLIFIRRSIHKTSVQSPQHTDTATTISLHRFMYAATVFKLILLLGYYQARWAGENLTLKNWGMSENITQKRMLMKKTKKNHAGDIVEKHTMC